MGYNSKYTGSEVEVILDNVKGFDPSDKQDKGLKFENLTAAVWVSDSTYTDFPYRCDIACEGVRDTDYAEVTFSLEQAVSGEYAPVCETKEDVVSVWSKSDNEITIPTIVVTNLSGTYNGGEDTPGGGDDNNGSIEPTILISFIRVNQNITDPSTMVSGDVKGDAIQAIRANSHRYLGKYTAENTMTVCQLDDADSNHHANGSKAYLDGTDGDVFMKLPKFWWKCYEEEEGSDIWTIGFAYGGAPDDTWKCWEGDELIGVFLGYTSTTEAGDKMYSVSKEPTVIQGSYFADCLSKTKERGNGYNLTRMNHFNILRLLFLAYYGNTDSQLILGNGHYIQNQTASMGMADSVNDGNEIQYINFWGVSDVFTCDDNQIGNQEIISNAVVSSDGKWHIYEKDDIVRLVELNTLSLTYVTKLVFGEWGDCLPKSGEGSDSTGFCDRTSISSSEGYLYCQSAAKGKPNGLFSFKTMHMTSSNNLLNFCVRVTFKGTILEEKDVEAFRLIEITN